MATLPEVTHADIRRFYPGDVEDFDVEFLDGKLGEVVDQISVRWGGLVASRLASRSLPERLYRAVVVRVASRVFANPEGLKREDAGQYSYERNGAVASGTLWFTADDERDLTGINPKQSSVIGTATIGVHTPAWS